VQLDLLPDFVVDMLGVVLVLQRFDAFAHALVIRRDALARQLLQTVPVSGFEQVFRMDRGVAKDPVMPVETRQQRLRDIEADL
jgi:hypothetical protein